VPISAIFFACLMHFSTETR